MDYLICEVIIDVLSQLDSSAFVHLVTESVLHTGNELEISCVSYCYNRKAHILVFVII